VLGARDKAGRWLQKANRALGGVAPLDLLDTDLGAEEVVTILGRIEHGVYS
jgi:putative toxin-antitoxin system antitoxin component (TIGR02293 family)